MRPKSLTSALISALGAWILAFSACACVATSFALDDCVLPLALCTALCAIVFTACFQFPRGGTALIVCIALFGFFAWREGTIPASASSLVYTISGYYSSAYGTMRIGTAGTDCTAALCAVAGCIALCGAWTLCRGKIATLAFSLTLLVACTCFVVTDTVPDPWCIFLLLFGLFELLLTNGARRNSPEQANTLTLITTAPLMLALLLLFWLVPQDGYVNRSQEYLAKLTAFVERVPELIEGASNDIFSSAESAIGAQSVDLRAQGPRTLYTYPVMDVIAAQSGTLYLREQDYDVYDGTGWSSTERRSEKFTRGSLADWESLGIITVATRRTRNSLFVPYYTETSVSLKGGCVENEDSTDVYEWRQFALPAAWRSTVAGTAGDADPRYLSISEDTERWAQSFLPAVVSGCISATEKADAVAAYVRASAQYSLDTQRMPASSEEFTRWFLEESDTGYCVHFATATAVLLRAAGVSTRYVTGYMADAIAGQQVTVTADKAHAWVEYYEPVLGIWIPLESTPAVSQSEPVPTESTTASTTIETEETQTVTIPEPSSDAQGSTSASVPSIGGNASGENTTFDFAPLLRVVKYIAIVTALLFAMLAQRSLRITLHRKRIATAKPNARALLLWQDVMLCAKLLGETPPHELESLAEKAKYSNHTLTAQELTQFEQYLRSARTRLRRKPPYLRAIHKWIFALY